MAPRFGAAAHKRGPMTVTAQLPSQRVEAVGRSKRLGTPGVASATDGRVDGVPLRPPGPCRLLGVRATPTGPDVLAIVLHLERPDARANGPAWPTTTPCSPNPELRSAFVHAAFLIVFISLIPVAIGLLLATAISRARLRGMTFFRTVLFFPQVLPLVVVGVIWDWMYQPDGPVNSALRALWDLVPSYTRGWVTSPGPCRP